MKHLLRCFLFATLCLPVLAEEHRSEYEKFFVGKILDVRNLTESFFPPDHKCTYRGGYTLSRSQKSRDGFGVDTFVCDGRELVFFTDDAEFPRVGWKAPPSRILDAVFLPPLKKGERRMMTGECELNGNGRINLIATVYLGKRDEVNWKTGVRAAWYFNTENGTIENLSTRNIICYRPTPP